MIGKWQNKTISCELINDSEDPISDELYGKWKWKSNHDVLIIHYMDQQSVLIYYSPDLTIRNSLSLQYAGITYSTTYYLVGLQQL